MGFSWWNAVYNWYLNNNSAREALVNECGIALNEKNLLSFKCPFSGHFKHYCHYECAKNKFRLAMRWMIQNCKYRPLKFINNLKTSLLKHGSLLLTNITDRPCILNIPIILPIMAEAVDDFMIHTSVQFKYTSTKIKDICPMNGPAKAICTLSHLWLGYCQSCTGSFIKTVLGFTLFCFLSIQYQYPVLVTTRSTEQEHSCLQFLHRSDETLVISSTVTWAGCSSIVSHLFPIEFLFVTAWL